MTRTEPARAMTIFLTGDHMPDGGRDLFIAGVEREPDMAGATLAGTRRLLLLRGHALEGLAQNRKRAGIDEIRQNDIAEVIERRALSSVERGHDYFAFAASMAFWM